MLESFTVKVGNFYWNAAGFPVSSPTTKHTHIHNNKNIPMNNNLHTINNGDAFLYRIPNGDYFVEGEE
jgi:hypothetical protein